MFEEPTLDDFSDLIRSHLDRAYSQAVDKFRAGDSRSGQAIKHAFDTVHRHLDLGLEKTLSELARVLKTTDLDARDLRRIAGELLSEFVDRMQAATRPEKLRQKATPGLKRFIDEQLAVMDQKRMLKLRQFDTGLLEAEEPEESEAKTNSITISRSTNVAIQQGTQSSQQISGAINTEAVNMALAAFESQLRDAELPADQQIEVDSCVQTIKAQLKRREPSRGILKEATETLKNIAEGIISSSVATALWRALGFC